MLVDLIFYISAFIVIWFGAGLIVSSIEDLSHKLNISPFAASFFVLGILTSLPEMSVGINSLIDGNPQIFVGNLIGASLVLFILVIPVLAISGKGIQLAHQLNWKNLLFALFVVFAPSLVILDGKLTAFDGVFLILVYLSLFYFIEKEKGLLEAERDRFEIRKTPVLIDVSRITIGAVLVFFSSKVIVDNTIYFASILRISPFLISLVVLSVGTNLPELSLALRSVALKKREVALGDYVGSAAANTFIFGFLTLLFNKEIMITHSFFKTFFVMLSGLGLFYLFTRTKNDISRLEGFILLLVYIAFIIVEYAGEINLR